MKKLFLTLFFVSLNACAYDYVDAMTDTEIQMNRQLEQQALREAIISGNPNAIRRAERFVQQEEQTNQMLRAGERTYDMIRDSNY